MTTTRCVLRGRRGRRRGRRGGPRNEGLWYPVGHVGPLPDAEGVQDDEAALAAALPGLNPDLLATALRYAVVNVMATSSLTSCLVLRALVMCGNIRM